MKKQEELKTLKDLDIGRFYFEENGITIGVSNLIKQEAIKWVKYMEDVGYYEEEKDDAVIDWIKHFFNITEEDLK